ncbi:hypothetical protein AB0873_30325 [Micromonospora sp. NPDC047707]|uniref:hypothetical protein n=1 Tax=Micromonospora sp. NPDC047707 TaxID=3154498 RepID=UPI00345310AD
MRPDEGVDEPVDRLLVVVALPAAAVAALREHLAEHVEDGFDALICTGAKGAPLRSGSLGRAVKWTKTVAPVGLAGFHFHDLHHTGNTLAAASGASTREPCTAWDTPPCAPP